MGKGCTILSRAGVRAAGNVGPAPAPPIPSVAFLRHCTRWDLAEAVGTLGVVDRRAPGLALGCHPALHRPHHQQQRCAHPRTTRMSRVLS